MRRLGVQVPLGPLKIEKMVFILTLVIFAIILTSLFPEPLKIEPQFEQDPETRGWTLVRKSDTRITYQKGGHGILEWSTWSVKKGEWVAHIVPKSGPGCERFGRKLYVDDLDLLDHLIELKKKGK